MEKGHKIYKQKEEDHDGPYREWRNIQKLYKSHILLCYWWKAASSGEECAYASVFFLFLDISSY